MKKISRQVLPGSVGSKSFLGIAGSLNRWDVLLFVLIAGIFFSADTGLNLFGFPLTTQKIGMGLAFVFLIGAGVRKKFSRIKISLPNTLVLLELMMAVVAISSSFISAESFFASLKVSLSLLFILVGTLIWFSLIDLSHDWVARRIIFLGIPFVLLGQLAGVIPHYFITGGVNGRLAGTIGNANEIGAVLFMSLPLVFTLLDSEEDKTRFFGGLALGAFLVGVFFTFSRSTYLVVGLFFLVVFIRELVRGNLDYLKPIVFLLVFLLVVGVLFSFLTPALNVDKAWNRLAELFSGDGLLIIDVSSVEYRLDAVIFGWQRVREKPFLGHGPINFEKVEYEKSGEGKNYHAFENTYIWLLVGLGSFGLLLFLSILGATFYVLYKNLKLLKDSCLRKLSENLIYGFAIFLILMLTNDFLFALSTMWVWVWVAFSLRELGSRTEKIVI